MEDRTDRERSNANMNSLVENQVNPDAPLLSESRRSAPSSRNPAAPTPVTKVTANWRLRHRRRRSRSRQGHWRCSRCLPRWTRCAARPRCLSLDGLDDDVLFEIISCLRTHEVIQIGAASPPAARAMTMKETVWGAARIRARRRPQANTTHTFEMYGWASSPSKLNAAVCAELVTLGCNPRRLCLQGALPRQPDRVNRTGLPPPHHERVSDGRRL